MYYPPPHTCIGHLSRVIRHIIRVIWHRTRGFWLRTYKIPHNTTATGLRAAAMRLCIGRVGDMKQCRRFISSLFDINIQFFSQKI